MSADQGYILFQRQHWDHPLLMPNVAYSNMDAWLWLLLNATHTARTVLVTNGRQRVPVHLQPGQLSHSIRFLAKKWSWSDRRVQHFLRELQTGGLATTQTTTGQTVITICNWDEIQRRGLSATAQTTTQSTTQTTTKKKQLKQLKKNTSVAEGKEGEASRRLTDEGARSKSFTEGFDLFWKAFPKKEAKPSAARAYAKVIKAGLISGPDLLAAAKRYAVKVASTEKQYIKLPAGWLNDHRWEDGLSPGASQTERLSADKLTDDQWRLYVTLFHSGSTQWPEYLGPKPGKPGCRVPSHLLIAPVQAPRAAATPVARSVRQQGSGT